MTDRPRVVVMFGLLLLIISIALISGTRQTLVTASSQTRTKESNNAGGHSQFYAQHNLVSDVAGLADHTDPNLVNAWGLDAGPTTPWWIADNGSGKATLYNVSSGAITIFTVPGAGGAQGNPTGLVFNGGTGFVVNNGVGAPGPARFIFASEDGTISAFKGNPIVTVVPNANALAHDAIYKGLAIDSRTAGQFLYATDFHNGKVDVFDSSFHAITLAGTFTDPPLVRISASAPAPAPEAPPMTAPFPCPAIAPITAPSAAPPPAYSAVRLFVPTPSFPSFTISFALIPYCCPSTETDCRSITRSDAP